MNRIVPLLLVAIHLNGCTETQNEQAINKKVIRMVFNELINEKKVNNIDQYYMPNVIDHSAWPGQLPGRDGLKKSIEDFHNAYPTLNVKIDELITADNKVITRESWKGVNRANNKAMSGTVMHIFQLKNGKVTDEWSEGWEWLQ